MPPLLILYFSLLLFQIIEGEDHTCLGPFNLIDLAGSERSAIAMISGERLQVNH